MGLTVEQAEIIGLFVGDGCLQKDYVCFWGNPKEDKEYYDFYLADLFRKAFEIEINPHHKKSNSVYGFYVCKRPVINFFINVGFSPGSKTYTVSVPKFVKNSDLKIKAAFLRGFIAADGCLNFDKRRGKYTEFKRTHHVHPRIILGTVSEQLASDLWQLLEDIGLKSSIQFKKSKNERFSDSYRVIVCGVKNLELWNRKIGFSTERNRTKYEIFKKHGFMPTNTSLEQRRKILKGSLSINTFYTDPWRSG